MMIVVVDGYVLWGHETSAVYSSLGNVDCPCLLNCITQFLVANIVPVNAVNKKRREPVTNLTVWCVFPSSVFHYFAAAEYHSVTGFQVLPTLYGR